jgi:hypothetical protein
MTCNACKQWQSHLISTCLQLEHKHTQISLEIFCGFHTQSLQFTFVKSKYETLSCWFSSCFIFVKAFQSIVCCYTILFHARHHCIFYAQFFFCNLICCFYGFQGPLCTLMWCIKFQLPCLNFTQPIYFCCKGDGNGNFWMLL